MTDTIIKVLLLIILIPIFLALVTAAQVFLTYLALHNGWGMNVVNWNWIVGIALVQNVWLFLWSIIGKLIEKM